MDAKERFVAEGACGGYYAVVWDRERKQIIFPYLRTGASISDDQIRAVAGELNGLLAAAIEQAVSEALEEACKAQCYYCRNADKFSLQFDEETWDQFGTASWNHFQNGELYDDCNAEKIRAAALRAKAGERSSG